MKLTLQLHPVTLILKETFTISRDAYSQRRALIVELSAGGSSGYGEASEHNYYGITLQEMMTKAEAIKPILVAYDFQNPEGFWQFLAPHLGADTFLQCAIDNAAHDLYGKLQQRPTHVLWGASAQELIKTSYTIVIDSTEKMAAKVRDTHFDIYKIKLGTDRDLQIIQALRKVSDADFIVDVNGGWDAATTIEYSSILQELGVSFIEQPLPAGDWDGMKQVFRASSLPVVADESCLNLQDIEKCLGHFHGINIKLMKCGGLTPARLMIERARSHDLMVMCGCMVESTVGISAIAQLVPYLDFVDMDGALLLARDIALGAKVLADGSIILPQGGGLGITMTS